ncbi:MAG: hypothetical protein HeimC3_45150 [Candidatus Heimdallarchaeota archaeon LC_3]|nr:MAG: hypothetical protein HeimC3_45150 [Candidatus Heimdallarchaeota archaeon LC_3]
MILLDFRPDEKILLDVSINDFSKIIITNLRFMMGSKTSFNEPLILWFRLINDYRFEDGNFYIDAYQFRLFKKIIGERKNFMKKINITMNREQAEKIIGILDEYMLV